jgi:hypothetical protein
MKEYYGTKRLKAKPMTRGEYNKYRGWEIPKDEDGSDKGYLVEYRDGGKANMEGHEGYVSWSPKDVFDAAYKATGTMNFGHALIALQEGYKVSRIGWNGKGMWLGFTASDQWGLGSNQPYDSGHIDSKMLPWIGMKTADGAYVPWLASQTDMLASDWGIVEDKEIATKKAAQPASVNLLQ